MISLYQSKASLLNKNIALLIMLLLSLQLLPLSSSARVVPSVPNIADSSPVIEDRKQQVLEAFGKLPVYFVSNHGQLNESVKYYATGPGYSFYLGQDAVTYSFVKTRPDKFSSPDALETSNDFEKNKAKEAYALKIEFLGANPKAELEGQNEQKGKVNYLLGNDPEKWETNVSTFSEVKYANLYPGIDLVYKGSQKKIKYEFIVSPGANPGDIRLIYDGVDFLRLDKQGDLRIGTPWGNLKDEKPSVYQLVGNKKVEIAAAFTINKNTVGFSLGSYDSSSPLIIDPGLVYSTFMGGSSDNLSFGISLDASGNAYITGSTYSSNFPTTSGAYDTSYNGAMDVFVTKLNADGSNLIYCTYLGGSSSEGGSAISLDTSGNVYITGYTSSPEFPTTLGAYDTSYNGIVDVFVAKLNANGSSLIYSTFLGGSSYYEWGSAISLDSFGNAYVSGYTSSPEFPTTLGAYDTSYNGIADVFVTKLNADGSSLIYSTFLGGSSQDWDTTFSLDASGNAYLTGNTYSSNFPTTAGAYDTSFNGSTDVFVTKLSANGSSLIYSTFLGGISIESGSAISLDISGNVYITGGTSSPDFPTTLGAYSTNFNGGSTDVFVTKLNPSGSSLVYSTLLGGSFHEDGRAIFLDETSGNSYVTGLTYSPNFPVTSGAHDTSTNGIGDAFITELNANGSTLIYSTFLGGSNLEYGVALSLDAPGNIYITGLTYSFDFPTTSGAYDTSYNYAKDIFVSKLDIVPPTVPAVVTATAISASQIDLSWSPSSDNTAVTGYRILRSTDALTFTLVGTPPSTSYSDTGLSPSKTYAYWVAAFDGAGNESIYSRAAAATTLSPPPAGGGALTSGGGGGGGGPSPGAPATAVQEAPVGYGTIGGRVVNTAWQVIPNAAIRVDNVPVTFDTRDGHFEAGMIPVGPHTVYYDAPGYQSQTQYVEIRKDQTTQLPTCLLSPVGAVAGATTGIGEILGRVVNQSWQTIPGTAVRINNSVVPTNPGGEFRFTLVYPGVYTIYYDASGYAGQTQVVEVKPGQTTRPPTAIMSRGVGVSATTGEIFGRVANQAGQMIPGTCIRINATLMPTNLAGEFRFSLVHPGVYTVYYDAPGYRGQTQVVEARAGQVTQLPTIVMSR